MTAIRTKVTSEFANIAQYTASTGELYGINLPGNVNANASNTGTFVVGTLLNQSNLLLSTSIGNGNINTGNMIVAGNANIALGQGTIKSRADANGYWLQSYGNDGNIAHQLFSSNGNANGSSTFALSASNVGNLLTANLARTDILSTQTTLSNANAVLAVTRGTTSAISTDEYLVIGSNSAGNVTNSVVATINSSNATASGVRWRKSGVDSWFIGTDVSSNVGNLVVFAPSGALAFAVVNTDNTVANTYNVSLSPTVQMRRSSTTVSQSTNYNVVWDQSDVFNIPRFTHVNGVFTNTGATRKFRFDYQCSGSVNLFGLVSGNVSEADIWFQYNETTVSTTNRFGQIAALNTTRVNFILSTSWTFVMNNNDTVTCWYFLNSTNSGSSNIGAAGFGLPADRSTRLNITQVL